MKDKPRLTIKPRRRLTLRGWRWGWRAVDENGQTMATDGSQRYSRKIDMVQAISSLQRDIAKAKLDWAE
jgi:uncharacterized protein YegP (UPF0339 family)